MADLEDAWLVFHSVAWQSLRGGRPGDGEADFVLFHPSHGIVVLEVKGGERIEIDGGTWFSTDHANGARHRIKNPFEQATASKHALIRYLAGLTPPMRQVPVCHAVVFPGVTIAGDLGPNAPRRLICDREDLRDLQSTIARILAHWNQRTRTDAAVREAIRDALAPTVSIRRRLVDYVADATEALIQLTDQQVNALQCLRLVRKAIVSGGAGTGKTLLAIHRARQYAEQGGHILLVCFNSLLSRWLRAQLADCANVRVETFHAFCMSEIRAAGRRIPANPDQDWWDLHAADDLVAAAEGNGTSFDAVIIDEGQDFTEDWIAALEILTQDPEAPFFVFADSHQELYSRKWQPSAQYVPITLDINCRNTSPIATRMSAIFEEETQSRGAEGPPAVHYDFSYAGGDTELIEQIVERLIYEEGLQPSQVTVLCDDSTLVRRLRERGVGEYSFTEHGGFGVAVETIKRFKGLESDAVVLVLTQMVRDGDPTARALAYVGISRAKSALFLLCTNETRSSLNWS